MGWDGNASADLILFLWVMLVCKCVVIILHFSSFRPIVTQHLFFRVSPDFLNETLQTDESFPGNFTRTLSWCLTCGHNSSHPVSELFQATLFFCYFIIIVTLATLNGPNRKWAPHHKCLLLLWFCVWFWVFSVLRVASRMGEDRGPSVRGVLCRVS